LLPPKKLEYVCVIKFGQTEQKVYFCFRKIFKTATVHGRKGRSFLA